MRVRFGGITLPSNLKKGSYTEIDQKEVVNILSKFNINNFEYKKHIRNKD